MIKCPNCEGEVAFDPELGKVKCKYCGSTFSAEEIDDKLKTSDETKSSDSFEGKVYRCTQCGAELMTFDDTAITFCSYCGSQAMIEDKMIEHNNPTYIIPFKKTRDYCISEYKRMISKFIYAPNYMKSDLEIEKFRGIYMPYWIYSFGKEGKEVSRRRKIS